MPTTRPEPPPGTAATTPSQTPATPGAGRSGRRGPRRARGLLYRPVSRRASTGATALTLVVLLGAWWAATAAHAADPLFLPSPGSVVSRFWSLLRSGELGSATWASFKRVSIGFLLATAIAIPVGIAIGTLRLVEAAIEPPLGFIRYMPAVAFVPLTVIWIGVGEPQKYLLIFIGTFFTETLMVMDNVKRIPRDLVDVGYTLGLVDRGVLRRIVLPAAAPAIWDTLRINLGWAWTWVVVAELIAADNGLGARIVLAQRYLDTETIFVAILTIGFLGLVMDQAMKWAGRRLFRWAEATR